MREVFEGDHSLNYGADDEHYFVYPKEKTLSELCKEKNTTAEKQKEKVEDGEGKKHSSVCSYIDMINDVSQKLKIGFEQYKKAKEEEIRKLKKELAKEKSISDNLLSHNLQLVQDLDEAKEENKQQALKLDKVQSENKQLAQKLDKVQSEKQQLAHDSEATQAENRQLAYKLYQAQESNKLLAKNSEDILKANQQLAQKLDETQKANQQLAHDLDEAQKENQQLAHDLGEAQTKSKELARGQGEAMAECSMLEYKLEEAQAENQKLSKKLDDARDEICCKDITIRRMKKDADRKAAAMVTDTSRMREDFAKEMIGSAVKFVKGLKKRINHGHEVLYTELLQQMTNGCFSEGESIRDELYKLIDEIPAYLKQIANEELRPNNVTVKEGGVYVAEVHHQNIHPKVDKRDSLPKADLSDFLPEVDMKDSLPRYKRRRFRLEGEDYEWK